jgi:hypothetical protein
VQLLPPKVALAAVTLSGNVSVSVTVSASMSERLVADSVVLKVVPAALEAGACKLTARSTSGCVLIVPSPWLLATLVSLAALTSTEIGYEPAAELCSTS